MYKSPIELLITEVANQIVTEQDEAIFKSVRNYVPNVDKGELIRALQYDRNQYEKGYADGKADAAPKWIPVTESLPDQYETVLCLLPTKECWAATWNEVGDKMWSDGESWCSESYITHWMPLPEPPKEGE